jgi:hypothetical protein
MTDRAEHVNATSAEPKVVVAAIFRAAEQARSTVGAANRTPIGHRVLRRTARLSPLVSEDIDRTKARGAAIEIAAEGLAAMREHEPKLNHRTPPQIKSLLEHALTRFPTTVLSDDDALRHGAALIANVVAEAAASENERRSSKSDASAAARGLTLEVIWTAVVRAARFAVDTWSGEEAEDLAPEDGTSPHQIASGVAEEEPSLLFAALTARQQALPKRLAPAIAALETTGSPIAVDLIADLTQYSTAFAELAAALDTSASSLEDLERALASRDPRRAALHALSKLEVVGEEPVPGVDDLRSRAADMLERLNDHDPDSLDGLLALLWLHDWIAAHQQLLDVRPDPNTVMGMLLGAQIEVSLAIPPAIDRLRLDHGADQVRPARPGADIGRLDDEPGTSAHNEEPAPSPANQPSVSGPVLRSPQPEEINASGAQETSPEPAPAEAELGDVTDEAASMEPPAGLPLAPAMDGHGAATETKPDIIEAEAAETSLDPDVEAEPEAEAAADAPEERGTDSEPAAPIEAEATAKGEHGPVPGADSDAAPELSEAATSPANAPGRSPEEPGTPRARVAPDDPTGIAGVSFEPEDLARLIERRLPGVAGACLPANDPRSAPLAALALVGPPRISSPACQVEFQRLTEDFDPGGSGEAAVIAHAAALSAIAWQPASFGLNLAEHTMGVVNQRPHLRDLTHALQDVIRRGIDLGMWLVPDRERAELLQSFHQLAVDARTILERPGTTNFVRATRLWQRWIDPDHGRIGRLLSVVAAQDRSRLAEIADTAQAHKRDLDGLLRRDDAALRGHGSGVLEGRARRDLISRASEALAVVEEAVRVGRELAADSKAERERHTVVVDKLIEQIERHEAAVLDEIGEGFSLARAAMSVVLSELRRWLIDHSFDSSDEGPTDPVLLMRGALLTLPDLALDEELLPREALDQADVQALAEAELPWEAAFKARLARKESRHARSLLAWKGVIDDPKIALIERVENRLRGDIHVEIAQVRADIDTYWRRGWLPAEAVARFSQDVDALDEEWSQPDAHPDATGLEDARDLNQHLTQAASQYRERRKYELRERLAGETLDDRSRRAVQETLDQGDIATAEDQIERLARGEAIETINAGDPTARLRQFVELVGTFRKRTPSEDEVMAAIEGRQDLDGLDFSAVRAVDGEVTAMGAVNSWFALSAAENLRGPNRGALLGQVEAVLHALGFDVESLQTRASIGRHTDSRNSFVAVPYDLKATIRGGAIVPQLGSEASGYRVTLLYTKNTSPNDLLATARIDEITPGIVITPQPLSMPQRNQIARLQREEPAKPPVLVVDPAVFLYAVSVASPDARPLLEATLPFNAINPYMPYRAGDVPPEMFFGRRNELDGLLAPRDGIALVYGGRRLGKSALLAETKRKATTMPGVFTLNLDLKNAGIGERNPPSALIPLLIDQLSRLPDMHVSTARMSDEERLMRMLEGWISADPNRRIVALLDEADEFLRVDATAGFSTVTSLYNLQRETQEKFRVVFAGLHQVQRFNATPNQRLTHFGRSAAIGPMGTTDARRLLQEPLAALGYAFESQPALDQILTATRNQPSLLQLVGYHLLRHLLSQPVPDELPAKISQQEVADLLTRQELVDQMRERMELTIALDPRYLVILLVTALETLELAGNRRPPRLESIRQACRYWWAPGFEETSIAEFRALLAEMIDLGVLYRSEPDHAYRLQSPSVRRMLGTPSQIEDRLLHAHEELQPPARFDGETFRRRLAIDKTTEPPRWSPLTATQDEEILRNETQLLVIAGTGATLIDDVPRAIEDAQQVNIGGSQRVAHKFDLIHPADGMAKFRSGLRNVGRQTHKVVAYPIAEPGALHDVLSAAQRALAGGRSKATHGTVCGVILVSVHEEVVEAMRQSDRTADVSGTVLTLALHRWQASGLRAVTVRRDDDALFRSELAVKAALNVTGGWPILVQRILHEVNASTVVVSNAVTTAIEGVLETMSSAAGRDALVASVGMDSMGPREDKLWEALLSYGAEIPLTKNLVDQDLADLAEMSRHDVEIAYRTLRLRQALVIDEIAETVAPEPVLKAAWIGRTAVAR